MEEDTLKGNLSVVFDDYSEQVSHACYSELVRARLPLRLPEAVRRIDDRLLGDGGTMSEMQVEVLRRNPNMDAETARALESAGFRGAVMDAVTAATARSKELGEKK